MVRWEGDVLLYRGSHDQLPPLHRSPAGGVTRGGSLWFSTSSSRNSLNCVIEPNHLSAVNIDGCGQYHYGQKTDSVNC